MAENKLQEIISIAADLMSTRGYSGTSLQNIADAVGIRKASLFHYVKSKEELLYKALSDTSKELNNTIKEITRHDSCEPEKQLQKAIEAHLKSVLHDVKGLNLYANELAKMSSGYFEVYLKQKTFYETIFEQIIKRLKAKGYFENLNSKVVTFSLLAMMNSVPKWYKPDGRLSVKAISNSLYQIILGKKSNTTSKPDPKSSSKYT